MERPVSIVWFERCYLGCVAVGLLGTALAWNGAVAKMGENPQIEQLGPSFVPTMLIGGVVLNLIASALLWYFTARKGAVVTKWIITVLFALNLVFSVIGLFAGGGVGGISRAVALVALVLNGIAVWQLFKPDTKVWFGEVKA